MPLDFPANPTNGQIYGSYIYNSTVGAWQAREDSRTVAILSSTVPTSANPGDIWVNTNDGISFVYYDDGTSAQWMELLPSGVPLLNTKANIAGDTFTGNVTAPRFISNIATGTSPFGVTSTTVVTNLNADLLDGQHATAFSPVAGSSSIVTVGNVTSGKWQASPVDVIYGGTGTNTLTSGSYLKGNGTNGIISQIGIPKSDIPTPVAATSRYTANGIIGTAYSTFVTTTITSTGRPTLVTMSGTYNNANSGANRTVDFRVQMDGVTLNEELTGLLSLWVSGIATPVTASDSFLVTPTAGSRSFTLQAKASNASSVGLVRASLTVVEL